MSRSTMPVALPETFSKRGFDYKQIRRNEHAAIYRQTWRNSDSPAFEVVIPVTRTQRRTEAGWQPCPPYEGYPSTEQWGKSGWTFTDLDRANLKFEEISQKALCASTGSRQNRSDSEIMSG